MLWDAPLTREGFKVPHKNTIASKQNYAELSAMTTSLVPSMSGRNSIQTATSNTYSEK